MFHTRVHKEKRFLLRREKVLRTPRFVYLGILLNFPQTFLFSFFLNFLFCQSYHKSFILSSFLIIIFIFHFSHYEYYYQLMIYIYMLKGITSKIHDLNAIFLLINKYFTCIRRMLQFVYSISYTYNTYTGILLSILKYTFYKLNIILRIQCR